jgi:Mn-dependent DtxR family transcriptional regulator
MKHAIRTGLIIHNNQTYALTPDGWKAAMDAVRSERIWEKFAEEFPENAVTNDWSPDTLESIDHEHHHRYVEELKRQGRWPDWAEETNR